MTNESVEVTPEDIETLALLHEAFGNQPAAFTLRNVGVVGTVLEVQAQIIAKHRTRHQSQERETGLTVGDLEGLIAGQPSPMDAAMAILAALTTPAPAVSNKLIVIGWIGTMIAYLNISREEAIRRWMLSEETETPPGDDMIEEFEFTDKFWTYEAGPTQ